MPSRPNYTIRINVPKAGKYAVSVLNNFTSDNAAIQSVFRENGSGTGKFVAGVHTKVYVAKADFELTQNGRGYPANTLAQYNRIINDNTFVGWYNSMNIDAETNLKEVYFPTAGEYFVSFNVCEESLEKNANVYHRIDVSSGVETGYTEFQMFLFSGIKLTPVDNAEFLAAEEKYGEIVNVDAGNGEEIETTIENAEVKAVAADVMGNSIAESAIIPSTDVAVGSSYKAVAAPTIDGYRFLYWARDLGKNRRIVSHNAEYSFNVTSGGTLLMAVYAKDGDEHGVAMFYNGNGQLLATQTGTYKIPALPSMAGFGTASHWALAGASNEFVPGETGEISGNMNFVAQYGELENVTITTNGTGGGEFAYGSDVTVTAAERNGTGLFNYWTNENGEILSFDKSYTFKALRNTTVTAVYKEFTPISQTIRKIVVSNSGKDVFAEFIGFENVIERGILFGENANLGKYTAKMTMSTNANHFAAYNDLEGEPDATGYAILDGGKVIYSK